MTIIDKSFMSPAQREWYEDIQKRGPRGSKELEFVTKMEQENRLRQARFAEQWERETRTDIRTRTRGTHPNIDTEEGREMEDPRL